MRRGVVTLTMVWSALLPGCQNPSDQARQTVARELELRRQAQQQCRRELDRGHGELAQGDLDDAAQHLRNAVQHWDRDPQAWMLLGQIEYRRKNLRAASEAFHKASVLKPLRYEPLYNMGMVMEAAGQLQRACELYEEALLLAPNQREVMENLVRTYVRSGTSPNRAKELIDRVLRLENRPQWRRWLVQQRMRLANSNGQNNMTTRPKHTSPPNREPHTPTTAPAEGETP